MFARTTISTVMAALIITTTAAAQSPPAEAAKSRITLGGAMLGAATVAEFHDQVDRAFGAAFNASYAIDSGRRIAMRLDVEWLNHGIESRDVRLATPFGGLRDVELQSSNDILFVEVGPEVRFPIGPAESYLGASAGLGYFVTTAYTMKNESNLSYTTTRGRARTGCWDAQHRAGFRHAVPAQRQRVVRPAG